MTCIPYIVPFSVRFTGLFLPGARVQLGGMQSGGTEYQLCYHDMYTFHLYLEVADAKGDTRQHKYSRIDVSKGVVCIAMLRNTPQ